MVSQAADASLATLFYALTGLIVLALCACNIYDLIKKCRRGDFTVNGGGVINTHHNDDNAVTAPHCNKKTKEPDLTLTYCTITILDEPLTGTIRVVNQNSDAVVAMCSVEEEQQQQQQQQQPSVNVTVVADFGNPVIELKSETSCSICLYEYAVNDSVFRNDPQKCQHLFHTECILTWIQRNSPTPECPCCRASIAVTRQMIFGTRNNNNNNNEVNDHSNDDSGTNGNILMNNSSSNNAGVEIPVTTTTTPSNAKAIGTTTVATTTAGSDMV